MPGGESWRERGPLLVEGFLARSRCEELCAAVSSSEAQPRSYQGVVDDKVRECRFVQVEWSACPELGNFATRCIEPEFDVSVQSNPSDPVMLYCYSEGVGFLPHHDEVTEIEMRRARHN